VVAVGGTSLKLKANGTRESESVWNDSGRPSHQEELKQYAATGGGCSTLFTAPSWQQNVQVITECEFEYGTSTGYGSSAPCATLPGSGSSPVAVSALLTTGLIANTEYHFRITATNAAGTAKGEDVTFKTP
jgi:hypothetical protein